MNNDMKLSSYFVRIDQNVENIIQKRGQEVKFITVDSDTCEEVYKYARKISDSSDISKFIRNAVDYYVAENYPKYYKGTPPKNN